jgi:hypothetical protein
MPVVTPSEAEEREGYPREASQVLGSVTPRWPWYLPPRSL